MVHLTSAGFLLAPARLRRRYRYRVMRWHMRLAGALALTQYSPRIPNWPEDFELTIAVIAEIHACYPWMSEERVGSHAVFHGPRWIGRHDEKGRLTETRRAA